MITATGIIPARFASTRFPGKPLIDLAGKSMIQRVYEQCLQSKSLSTIIIATDDEIIFEPQEPENESFLIRDVVIGVKFHWERKEKQRFTHSLKLIKDNGKITAINIVPIEKYLVSVISSEMSPKCSMPEGNILCEILRNSVQALSIMSNTF